jgi:hypothetical protein
MFDSIVKLLEILGDEIVDKFDHTFAMGRVPVTIREIGLHNISQTLSAIRAVGQSPQQLD